MRKFGEEQGGFRPDRATMDHVFVLNEVVRSRKTSGLDSHICFFVKLMIQYSVRDCGNDF